TPAPEDDRWKVEVHDRDGALLNGSFVTGLSLPARDPVTGFIGGAFLAVREYPGGGVELYLLHNGALYRYSQQGVGTLIGTGFKGFTAGMQTGPDGSLYVAQNNGANQILRLTPLVPDPRVTVRVEDGRG